MAHQVSVDLSEQQRYPAFDPVHDLKHDDEVVSSSPMPPTMYPSTVRQSESFDRLINTIVLKFKQARQQLRSSSLNLFRIPDQPPANHMIRDCAQPLACNTSCECSTTCTSCDIESNDSTTAQDIAQSSGAPGSYKKYPSFRRSSNQGPELSSENTAVHAGDSQHTQPMRDMGKVALLVNEACKNNVQSQDKGMDMLLDIIPDDSSDDFKPNDSPQPRQPFNGLNLATYNRSAFGQQNLQPCVTPHRLSNLMAHPGARPVAQELQEFRRLRQGNNESGDLWLQQSNVLLRSNTMGQSQAELSSPFQSLQSPLAMGSQFGGSSGDMDALDTSDSDLDTPRSTQLRSHMGISVFDEQNQRINHLQNVFTGRGELQYSSVGMLSPRFHYQ